MGTSSKQYGNGFLREECSISANLMSARLAFSMSLHTPFVQLLTERTKEVTMDAPPNKYGFEMPLLFIYLKLRSSLSVP